MSKLSQKLTVAFLVVSFISMGIMVLLARMIFDLMIGYFTPGQHMSMMANFSGISADQFQQALNVSYLMGGFISILISFVSSYLVVMFITRPLRKLSRAADKIANGDLSERVEINSEDEIGQLAKSFNSMATSLERTEQQRRAFYADIVHELRNPLTVARCRLDAMLDGLVSPNKDELTSVHHEMLLISRLITDLRDLSLANNGQLVLHKKQIDFESFMSRIVEESRILCTEKGISLTSVIDPIPFLNIDQERIIQVMYNLLSNGIRHTPSGGSITVNVQCEAKKRVVVSVEDTGSGIPESDLDMIFERFYRVDPSRSRSTGGTGLGLAIAKQLIHLHGGDIWVESQLGKGSKFSFFIPVRQ
jgi:two-component system sensor histidine kinase BaeS